MNTAKIAMLYDLDKTIAKELFEESLYPWEVLPAIKEFIASIVTKNTLVAGIVSCQFISNVPTAIFLSKFTENYRELLVSVNIGSLGIIISSLASLITLKEFLKHQPKNFKKYMGMFTLINTAFLAVMLVITMLT